MTVYDVLPDKIYWMRRSNDTDSTPLFKVKVVSLEREVLRFRYSDLYGGFNNYEHTITTLPIDNVHIIQEVIK